MPVRTARRGGIYRRHPLVVPKRKWVGGSGTITAPVVEPPLLPELRVSIQFGSAARRLNGLDGQSMADLLRHSSIIPGGFLAAEARISFAEFYAYRSTVYKYGATVTISVALKNGAGETQPDGGSTVWQGFLTEVTPNADVAVADDGTVTGTATLRALGWQHLLHEREDPVPLQTRHYGDLDSTDSDPYASQFDHDDSIKANVKPGSVVWSVEKGVDIVGQDVARVGLFTDEVNVKRVAGTLRAKKGVPGGASSPNYKVKVERFPGPTDFSGVVVDTADLPTSPGTSPFDITLGVPSSLVTIGLYRTGVGSAVTLAAYKVTLTSFRANGVITQADSYLGSQVFAYLCSKIGFATTLVTATTTNVLPIWWLSGEWWDLVDYVAQADAVKWGIWELAVGGEFRPWTAGNLWTVRCYGSSAHAEADIEPSNDVYSEVVVKYKLVGKPRTFRKRAYVTPNPFAALSNPARRRVYTTKLEDPQPDGTFAQTVANTLRDEFASEQFMGTIKLSAAVLGGTFRTAELIRAGERVYVPDYPGGAKTFRIYATDGGDGNGVVTLQVGRTSKSKLARALWAAERKRKFSGKDPS